MADEDKRSLTEVEYEPPVVERPAPVPGVSWEDQPRVGPSLPEPEPPAPPVQLEPPPEPAPKQPEPPAVPTPEETRALREAEFGKPAEEGIVGAIPDRGVLLYKTPAGIIHEMRAEPEDVQRVAERFEPTGELKVTPERREYIKALGELHPYQAKDEVGKYDLIEAVKEVPQKSLLAVGFTPEQIQSARDYIRQEAEYIRQLEDYNRQIADYNAKMAVISKMESAGLGTADKGFDLPLAVGRGLVTDAELRRIGYTQAQIEQARSTSTATAEPMNLDNWTRVYFREKGWTVPHRGVATPSNLQLYDARLLEATAAYTGKYSTADYWRSVLGTAPGKLISLTSPLAPITLPVALALAGVASPLAYLYPVAQVATPTAKIVAPEGIKGVTGAEWATGVIGAASIVLPQVLPYVLKQAGYTLHNVPKIGRYFPARPMTESQFIRLWSQTTKATYPFEQQVLKGMGYTGTPIQQAMRGMSTAQSQAEKILWMKRMEDLMGAASGGLMPAQKMQMLGIPLTTSAMVETGKVAVPFIMPTLLVSPKGEVIYIPSLQFVKPSVLHRLENEGYVAVSRFDRPEPVVTVPTQIAKVISDPVPEVVPVTEPGTPEREPERAPPVSPLVPGAPVAVPSPVVAPTPTVVITPEVGVPMQPVVTPTPSPAPAIVAVPSPVVSLAPEPAVSPFPQPAPAPQPQPLLQPQPQPQPVPTPAPQPVPTLAPLPVLPPPPVIGIPRPGVGVSIPRARRGGGYPPYLPDGSIVWKQGFTWKYIPPPYDAAKPYSLGKRVPPGAVDTGSNRPANTLQIVGTALSVPRLLSVDLGWTDVFIRDGRDIKFKSGGEYTDVGERISTNTQGMTVSRGFPEEQPVTEEDELREGELREDKLREVEPREEELIGSEPAPQGETAVQEREAEAEMPRAQFIAPPEQPVAPEPLAPVEVVTPEDRAAESMEARLVEGITSNVMPEVSLSAADNEEIFGIGDVTDVPEDEDASDVLAGTDDVFSVPDTLFSIPESDIMGTASPKRRVRLARRVVAPPRQVGGIR